MPFLIEKVHLLDQIKSNYMKEWFINCINLTTLINFKKLDVSDCTNFSRMFAFCESLQNINELQNWNVSNGTDFLSMFEYCILLKEISLSNTLDILKKEMFYNCNPNLKIHWKGKIYTCEDLMEYQEF